MCAMVLILQLGIGQVSHKLLAAYGSQIQVRLNRTQATGTLQAQLGTSVNSGFCREVDENCVLLGHYSASSGNSLPTTVPKRR